jgi:glucose-6-phosphate 1-epimerase
MLSPAPLSRLLAPPPPPHVAGAAVAVTSNKWSDVVVWSPWEAMPDCYRSFVCVENAQFSSPVRLAPGEFWRSQAEWAVIDL